MLNYLILEPLRKQKLDMALLRFSQLMHVKMGGKFDMAAMRVFRMLKRKLSFGTPLQFLSESELESVGKSLDQKGWSILPYRLSSTDIKFILDIVKTHPAHMKDFNDNYKIDDIENTALKGRFHWKSQDLVKNPAIQKLLAAPDLHRIAQEYLGCAPYLAQVALWLDTVNDKPLDEHVFHYDNDGPKFLKFFFYLTDTDEKSGAHKFIQKTHGPVKVEQFHKSRRYTDEELISHYGAENVITFSAPAGTVIAEDTSGFHRGTTPINHARVMMVLEYCVFDNENLVCKNAFDPKPAIPEVSMDLAVRKIVKKYFQ